MRNAILRNHLNHINSNYREFKKLLRRRRRQRRLKKWIYILPTNLGILLGHLRCLSLSKLSRNCIWDTSINLKQNFTKLAVVLHVLQTTQNWSFHVVVLPRTTKKCTKIYNARAQPLFCSLNLLFSDVPVAVAVVVISNYLILSPTVSTLSERDWPDQTCTSEDNPEWSILIF